MGHVRRLFVIHKREGIRSFLNPLGRHEPRLISEGVLAGLGIVVTGNVCHRLVFIGNRGRDDQRIVVPIEALGKVVIVVIQRGRQRRRDNVRLAITTQLGALKVEPIRHIFLGVFLNNPNISPWLLTPPGIMQLDSSRHRPGQVVDKLHLAFGILIDPHGYGIYGPPLNLPVHQLLWGQYPLISHRRLAFRQNQTKFDRRRKFHWD